MIYMSNERESFERKQSQPFQYYLLLHCWISGENEEDGMDLGYKRCGSQLQSNFLIDEAWRKTKD